MSCWFDFPAIWLYSVFFLFVCFLVYFPLCSVWVVPNCFVPKLFLLSLGSFFVIFNLASL